MKVKAVKDFRDKHTKTLHRVGETLEMSQERYKEVNGTSLGVFVKKVTEKKPVAKK